MILALSKVTYTVIVLLRFVPVGQSGYLVQFLSDRTLVDERIATFNDRQAKEASTYLLRDLHNVSDGISQLVGD
ncbi:MULTISPECIES: hypothetical protein [unclassified Nostoc]|uniref:hypothetical protein n=1 Tax=unclassified Nostoc TaxID=2593658 RepID=UPI002AD59CBF|nr:hypothetical protein [Nostoc sp. DedQUE03]MDZ7976644.1 hypothetical protein [Nostoc sp. DedQUE03]MDZ8048739.1 hypothetical protein [Nostoc sp. DedQUE02]